ncbi:MAG: immunoglobulin domain-containing protein, partial [Oscillospiraceae bacterium]|nr:immunoglobulin domain-containing protein [Oscillospiraceae bacterium]
ATSYQWYYRTSSSGSWTAVAASSGKTSTYSLTAAARHNGYQYRCKVTNAAGSVYSNTVTLTVNGKPVITTQPTSWAVTVGQTAIFKVTATGATSYQWYYRTSSTGSWTAVAASSGKTSTYSLTAAARHNGYQYRCKVSNATGYVYTSIVTLMVN